MPKSGNERITVRLSNADMRGLDKIRASGDFEDMSASVRFCIHFTVSLMKVIPAAIVTSISETEETFCEKVSSKTDAEGGVPDNYDTLENTAEKVQKYCLSETL